MNLPSQRRQHLDVKLLTHFTEEHSERSHRHEHKLCYKKAGISGDLVIGC